VCVVCKMCAEGENSNNLTHSLTRTKLLKLLFSHRPGDAAASPPAIDYALAGADCSTDAEQTNTIETIPLLSSVGCCLLLATVRL